MRREFYINTPVGKLHVWSKHEEDNELNFPGVYIDLVTDHGDEMLACVEYESMERLIQTCIYHPKEDVPTYIVKYNTDDFKDE